MRRQHKLYHTFRYDPTNLRRGLRVPCSPAKYGVTLTRSDADILKGVAGSSVGCLNSNCAMRRGAEAFGHGVYLAEFTKTSAYIVDRLDKLGQPAHCVWYRHNDPLSVDLNDSEVDRKELARKIAEKGRVILLRPPKLRAGVKNIYANGTHRQAARGAQTPRRNAVARGALRRAQMAGIVLPVAK